MEKLNIFETNKYIYIQKDKDGNRFKHLFPDAEEVTMDWQNTIMPNKSSFFIVPNLQRALALKNISWLSVSLKSIANRKKK